MGNMGWRDPIVRVRRGKHDLSVLHPSIRVTSDGDAILVRHGDLDLASSSFLQRTCDILYTFRTRKTEGRRQGSFPVRHMFIRVISQ